MGLARRLRPTASIALTAMDIYKALAATVLFVALLAAAVIAPRGAEARGLGVRGSMSWYGPSFYGHTTSCGKTLTGRSLYVAALTPRLYRCGMKLTVYVGRHRYWVKVQDRGTWRSDGRVLDAAPGLRARIGFYGVIGIRYRRGWR